MIPVSVCMIAKNEETRIERTLASLAPYGFEIVVVDTGSTDRTKEIAAKYTSHIYDFTWIDDFSAARNYSLSKASNEWIFMMDCDEWIEHIDIEELTYFMKHLSHAAGAITRENITGTPENPGHSIDRTERFFSKKRFHYTGIIHEQLTPIGAANFECLLLNTTIGHDGYCMSDAARYEKSLRNVSLLEKQLQAEPDNPYVYYQLGKGYEMIEDYATACKHFDKALTYDLDMELAYVQALIVSYGHCLLHIGHHEAAMQFEHFYPTLANSADFVYLMGLIYMKNGLYEKALDEFEKALTFDFANRTGSNTYLPCYQIGQILLMIGEKETAAHYFSLCGDYPPALEALKKENPNMLPISVCIIAKNEADKIEEFLSKLRPYDWEIIVLDTGSTDKTKEIAAKYADIISDFVWCNDFSAARNASIALANREYILILDCDEFIKELDVEELLRLIHMHPHKAGCIMRENHFTDADGLDCVETEYIERLFPKAEYHYEQTIHEQLVRNDQTEYERYQVPLIVNHTGYLLTEEEMLAKVKRNMDLLQEELSRDKDNPYLLYQIGQCYNMLDDHENAYQYYRKAILSNLDPRLTYMHSLVIAYGSKLLETNRLDEAELLLQIYDAFAVTADFFCLIGEYYMQKNDALKAMLEFLRASQAEQFFIEDNKINVPFYKMGYINEVLGDKEAAVMHYKRCTNYPPAIKRLENLTFDKFS
ncbi:MAG: glycosyltransferase [Lachnospiraceae bacterium]|nr:glycosyltransferase [Lachnospiraceae bacterium]